MRIWNHCPLDGSGFDRYTYPRCLEVILEHGVEPDAKAWATGKGHDDLAAPLRRHGARC